MDRPGELRPRLIERQREWEEGPHPGFDDRSPVEVVEAERSSREEW